MYKSTIKDVLHATLPMASSLLSFSVSSAMMFQILRSKTKLNKPNRRIIFMMSFFDTLQSIATLASVFASPSGSKMWAIGNDRTCAAQGFFLQLGVTGSPLYTVCLAFYYVCIIKHDMRETHFGQKIEPYLHAIPNLWVWGSAIFLVFSGNMNNAGYGCWIASYPQNCVHDLDVECIRGANAFVYRYLFVAAPTILSFLGCIVMINSVTTYVLNLSSSSSSTTRPQKRKSKKKKRRIPSSKGDEGVISKHANKKKAKKQNTFSKGKLQRKSQRTRSQRDDKEEKQLNPPLEFPVHQLENRDLEVGQQNSQDEEKSKMIMKERDVATSSTSGRRNRNSVLLPSTLLHQSGEAQTTKPKNKKIGSMSPDVSFKTGNIGSNIGGCSYAKPSKSTLSRNREVVVQALMFILSFFFTYVLSYIKRLHEHLHGEGPYWFNLTARTLLGFQGFFNVYVHTRPHVISLRKRKKEYSWIRAFIAVIKNGGDNDGNGRGMRRSKRRLSWISRHNDGNGRGMKRSKRCLSWISRHRPEAQGAAFPLSLNDEKNFVLPRTNNKQLITGLPQLISDHNLSSSNDEFILIESNLRGNDRKESSSFRSKS